LWAFGFIQLGFIALSRKILGVTQGTIPSSKDSTHTLILGGAGFIGSRLAKLLTEQSIPVLIGDLNESHAFPRNCTRCDVTRGESFTELTRNASAIINLAAAHRDDVRPLSRYREVNVEGAVEVCNAARKANVHKIIFTSSVAVYGFHQRAIDENGPFEPFNEYGKTKLEAEVVYRAWAEEDPARTLVIVRPTVVFGEGNRGNVYNLLRQIASGKFFMVGSGTNIKSMAYVENIAAFLAHSLTLGPGVHIANYVDGPDLNTRDLIAHIHRCLSRPGQVRRIPKSIAMTGGHLLDVVARVSGRSFPVSAIRVRKFCETTQFKADRVAQWGFKPPYSLTDGLARTVDFEFRNQLGTATDGDGGTSVHLAEN
jgi:nucleoside-diphosphate-sugar epimerase